jgi:hypothetical protein
MPEYKVNVTILVNANTQHQAYLYVHHLLGVRDETFKSIPPESQPYAHASETRHSAVRYVDSECMEVIPYDGD